MTLPLTRFTQLALGASPAFEGCAIRLDGDQPTLRPAQPPAGRWARFIAWFTASPERKALVGFRRSLASAFGDQIARDATRPLRHASALRVQDLRTAIEAARALKERDLVDRVAPALLAQRSPGLPAACSALVLALVASSQHLVGPTGEHDVDARVKDSLAILKRLSLDSGISMHSLEPIASFALRGRTGPEALALAQQLIAPTADRHLLDAQGIVQGTLAHEGLRPGYAPDRLLATPAPFSNVPLGDWMLDGIQKSQVIDIAVDEDPPRVVRIAQRTNRDAGASELVVGGQRWGIVRNEDKPAAERAFAIGLRDAFPPGEQGDAMALAVSRCMNQDALNTFVPGSLAQAFGTEFPPLLSTYSVRAFEARPGLNASWLVDAAYAVEFSSGDDPDGRRPAMYGLFRVQYRIEPAAAGAPRISIAFADVALSN